MTASDSEPPHQAILLRPWARWVAGTAGIASGGFGGWSVFLNTNQAGSAALLLFGALFTLMSLSGRVPDRISKDGVEHLTTAAEQATTETVNELLESPATRDETAEAMMKNWMESVQRLTGVVSDDYRVDVDNPTIRMAREINLQNNVRTALANDFEIQKVFGRPGGSVDLAVTGNDGRRVGLEVRLVTRGTQEILRSLVKRFGNLVANGEFRAVVIVLAQRSDSSAVRFPMTPDIPGIAIVLVDDQGVGRLSTHDQLKVSEAVRSALNDGRRRG